MALATTKKVKLRVRRPEDLERVGVLAIESMLPMMGILSGILRSFRFNTVSVLGNSDEAWSRLNGEPKLKADIILLDWNAHPVNGEAFVRQLRRAENPVLAETAVVAIIANADREIVFAARDAGANVVLLRPFSAAQLLDKVMWTLSQDTPFIRSEGYVGPDRRRFNSGDYTGALKRRSDTRATPSGIEAAIGSSLRLPLVITSGRSTSESRRWWSGEYASMTPIVSSPGATDGARAPFSRALSSTIGRSRCRSSSASRGLTSAIRRASPIVRTMTASGFASRRLRSRSRRTASSLVASTAR